MMEHITLDWKRLKINEIKILEKYTRIGHCVIVILFSKEIRNNIFILFVTVMMSVLITRKIKFYYFYYFKFWVV